MLSDRWPPFPDIEDALPSVEPPPLALFEEEEFGVEVDNLDGLFYTYRDTSISPLASPFQDCKSTNSTGRIEATSHSNSEYSSTAYSTPNYSSTLLPDTEEALPSVEPPPLALFEEEEFGVEVDNLEVPTLLDGLFDTYRDTSISPLASSPQYSETTDSAGLIEANSEYSSTAYSTSINSSTLDFALRLKRFSSEYNANDVDSGQNSVSPALLNSFGALQFSQASFQHVNVVNAQSDDGQNQPPVGISPDSLSVALQGPTPVPKDPPIDAAPATQPRTGPIRKAHECPICGDRKYNFHSFYMRYSMFLFSIYEEV